jgi:hypothetical protein
MEPRRVERLFMRQTANRGMIILVLAFVGWAACAAIIGIGMAVSSQINALIAHAIGAPIVFALISLFYFRRFGYTTPIQTAVIFLTFVFLMDFFVVAFVIMRSFEMFTSVLGTWIPFVLIFLSTYATGLYAARKR